MKCINAQINVILPRVFNVKIKFGNYTKDVISVKVELVLSDILIMTIRVHSSVFITGWKTLNIEHYRKGRTRSLCSS